MGDNRFDMKKLCLMGLDEDGKLDDIRELCAQFGQIVDVYRPKTRPEMAFVEYATEDDAKKGKSGLIESGYRVNNAYRRDKDNSQINNGSHATANALKPKDRQMIETSDNSDTCIESSDEEFIEKRAHSACTLCTEKAYLTCSRCGSFYCTVDCQRTDWLQHKTMCFPMPKLIPAQLTKKMSRSNSNLNKAEPIDVVDSAACPMEKVAQPPRHEPTVAPMQSPRDLALSQMLAKRSNATTPVPITSPEPPKQSPRDVALHQMLAKRANASTPVTSPEVPKQIPRESAIAQLSHMCAEATPPKPSIVEPIEVAITEPPTTPVKKIRCQPQPVEEEIASDGSRSPQIQHSPSTTRFLKALRCRTPSDHSLPEDHDEALVRNKDFVRISEVVSHHSVYVQPVNADEELQSIHMKVYEATARAPALTTYPKCGDIVAAPFECEYYRGRVVSVNITTDMIRISYIDYGNAHEVMLDKLKELPVPLQSHRRLSMRVTLAGIPVDIDESEATNVKRQLVLHQEMEFQLMADTEKVAMNAPIVLINKIDELSLNEAMMKHCTERIYDDELRYTTITGADVELIVRDTDDLHEGMVRCILAEHKPRFDKTAAAVLEHGKRLQTAPAYVPQPHELCVYRETVAKGTKWHRAVFNQALANDVCQLINVDTLIMHRKIPMNNIRAYDRSLSMKVYMISCKVRGCGRMTVEEWRERFEVNPQILAKNIEYREARQAHIIEIAD